MQYYIGKNMKHVKNTINEFNTIKTYQKNHIGYVILNRPKQRNALNTQVQNEVISCLNQFDSDKNIKCIIITGSEEGKAFAAGADIKELSSLNEINVRSNKTFAKWNEIRKIKIPIIAAVEDWALGGGCELAMMCDIIIAADTAKFGQPEITIGTIPGMGGTQRLTKIAGKSKSMEWILTGEQFDAFTAERIGLVSRVVPASELLAEAEITANKIASMSRPVIILAKECVNKSYEGTLNEGIEFERDKFYSTFALKDKTEGMNSFVEKRSPIWSNE